MSSPVMHKIIPTFYIRIPQLEAKMHGELYIDIYIYIQNVNLSIYITNTQQHLTLVCYL